MFRKLRVSTTYVGLSLAAGLLSILLSGQRPCRELELKSQDLRLKWFQRHDGGDTSIVLVVIDDEDIRRYGPGEEDSQKWPLPRSLYARLVDTLSSRGAKVIGFDLLFLHPDRFNTQNDMQFAHSAQRAGNVALPFTFDCPQSQGEVIDILRFRVFSSFVFTGYEGHPEIRRVCVPLDHFCNAASTMGFVESMPDLDGVHRRIPLVVPYKGFIFPHINMSILCEFLGFDCDSVVVRSGAIEFQGGDTQQFPEIPIDNMAQMLISFRQSQKLPILHLRDAFESYTTGLYQDKIVLVGVSAYNLGIGDWHPTPVDHAMPGIVIHACVMSDILNHHIVSLFGEWTNRLLILLLCLAMSILMSAFLPVPDRHRSKPSSQELIRFVTKGLILVFVTAGIYSCVVVGLFIFDGKVAQWTPHLMSVLLIYILAGVGLYAPQMLLGLSQRIAQLLRKPQRSQLYYSVLKKLIITGFFFIGYVICKPPPEKAFLIFLLYLSVLGLLSTKDLKEFMKK